MPNWWTRATRRRNKERYCWKSRSETEEGRINLWPSVRTNFSSDVRGTFWGLLNCLFVISHSTSWYGVREKMVNARSRTEHSFLGLCLGLSLALFSLALSQRVSRLGVSAGSWIESVRVAAIGHVTRVWSSTCGWRSHGGESVSVRRSCGGSCCCCCCCSGWCWTCLFCCWCCLGEVRLA